MGFLSTTAVVSGRQHVCAISPSPPVPTARLGEGRAHAPHRCLSWSCHEIWIGPCTPVSKGVDVRCLTTTAVTSRRQSICPISLSEWLLEAAKPRTRRIVQIMLHERPLRSQSVLIYWGELVQGVRRHLKAHDRSFAMPPCASCSREHTWRFARTRSVGDVLPRRWRSASESLL